MPKPRQPSPFSNVSNRLERPRAEASELASLFGDLPAENRQLLEQLRSREAEIIAWMSSDARRVALLEQEPRTVLEELLTHLRMEQHVLRPRPDLPQEWRVEVLKVRKVPTGEDLLQAVWAHLNAAEAHLTAFKADPFAVVDTVAATTNATAAQKKAVVDALSTVLGTAPGSSGSILDLVRDNALVDRLGPTDSAVFLYRK